VNLADPEFLGLELTLAGTGRRRDECRRLAARSRCRHPSKARGPGPAYPSRYLRLLLEDALRCPFAAAAPAGAAAVLAVDGPPPAPMPRGATVRRLKHMGRAVARSFSNCCGVCHRQWRGMRRAEMCVPSAARRDCVLARRARRSRDATALPSKAELATAGGGQARPGLPVLPPLLRLFCCFRVFLTTGVHLASAWI
jgi:hypothetical protein